MKNLTVVALSMVVAAGCGRWKQDLACQRACALAVNDGGAPDSSFDERRDPAEVDQALAKADEACSSRPDLKSLAQQARTTVEKGRKRKAEERAALDEAKAEKAKSGDGGATGSATTTGDAGATPPASADAGAVSASTASTASTAADAGR